MEREHIPASLPYSQGKGWTCFLPHFTALSSPVSRSITPSGILRRRRNARLPRAVLNQRPSSNQQRLQAFSVENHVGAPIVRKTLGYGQLLAYLLTDQIADTSTSDCKFASVANGRAPCLVRWVALSHGSCYSDDGPLSLSIQGRPTPFSCQKE